MEFTVHENGCFAAALEAEDGRRVMESVKAGLADVASHSYDPGTVVEIEVKSKRDDLYLAEMVTIPEADYVPNNCPKDRWGLCNWTVWEMVGEYSRDETRRCLQCDLTEDRPYAADTDRAE